MKSRPTVMLAAAVIAVALLGGCAAKTQKDRYKEMLANVTPELNTLYERQVDMDNHWAIMMDENGRMFVEDLGRAFYTDRPSYLTPEPVPRP
jgi:hypothetical protein